MAKSKSDKRVPGYEGESIRRKLKLVTEEYEYELPFNYENVTVNRRHYRGSEFHGIEMNVVNAPDGIENYTPLPADSIVIEEPYPIVRVVVIGSACTPPGYVQIECEPIEGWRRPDELESVMPVRMRINGLWGMHLRYDQWFAKDSEVNGAKSEEYERMPKAFTDKHSALASGSMKSSYHEFPLAGMSSAVFETPPSKRVIVL